MGKRLGYFRAVYLVALCCTGSFLFAYDTGIIGGVLSLKSFLKDFHVTTSSKSTVSGNAASLLQAGAFFACFFIWPFTAKFGRRWSLVLASLIFEIGAIIQVIKTGSLAAFYVARVISGVGVGMATVIIPMYSAEMAPKEIRGQLGAMFQFFYTLGVLTSYWVDYGVTLGPSITRQWQIPIGLQIIPAGILGLGMLLTKESTRWLAKTGQREKALESLVWVRGGDSPEVQEEFAEILAGIQEEERITEGLTWKELLLPVNRFRFFLVITLQIGVQLTGNTSLANFAPQVFAAVGAGSNNYLFSGFFGVIKVIACGTFLLFFVDTFGRRKSLLVGAFAMGACHLVIALLTITHPPKAGAPVTGASAAAIAFVYLEAFAYNQSWGPVPWLYQSEIFPNRIREAGVAVGTATQWLWNFAFSQITPHALTNLGGKTFIIFFVLNWALVVYAWFMIKETKGKSLEEMEDLFGSSETAINVEKVHEEAKHNAEVHADVSTS
ncbi:putative MFS sugar transporter [Xylariaceae sp. FL0255]|nr:putative MFS sugar transporter [Xylariaceae sp. FL0255]